MKAETYLNALIKARDCIQVELGKLNRSQGEDIRAAMLADRRMRQYDKFETALRRKMADMERRIEELEAQNQRLIDAAAGRGMVSELADMREAAALVAGLHDRIQELEDCCGDAENEYISDAITFHCPACEHEFTMYGVIPPEIQCPSCNVWFNSGIDEIYEDKR